MGPARPFYHFLNEIKLFMAIFGRPHGVQKVDVPLLGDKGEAEHVERARP